MQHTLAATNTWRKESGNLWSKATSRVGVAGLILQVIYWGSLKALGRFSPCWDDGGPLLGISHAKLDKTQSPNIPEPSNLSPRTQHSKKNQNT